MNLPNGSDLAQQDLLLEATEVPPVLEENAAGRSPFLLTCDHYGRLIPRALGDLGVSAAEMERHIAWDIGIAGVAEQLAKTLDAHLVAQRYSRLVIDCNRPPQAGSSIPLMSEALRVMAHDPSLELLWASPREVLNIAQAEEIGVHIITVTHDLLAKQASFGKDLEQFSLETVQMFHRDASAAGYTL